MALAMHGQPPELSAAIDRIYGAVLEPAAWSDVLSDLVDRAGGTSAMLLASDVVSGEGDVALSRYNDPGAYAPYRAYYASINPLHNVADPVDYATGWRPTMLRDEEWMARDAIEATEYYNDFLRPIGACYGLYLRLSLDGRMLTSISIGRGEAAGRFEDAAMAALTPLHGHLIRAAGLGRRFAEVKRFAAGATAAMDAAGDPLLLLDDTGGLVHANAAGERLLSTGGRRLPGQIEQAVATAIDPDLRRGSSFRLPARDGGADVSVLPIALEAGREAAGGPAVLVRVTPGSAADRIEVMLERFGLTAAERLLALALVRGESLHDAAEARGISINTARRHLAGIFDKTGVRRQAELVGLLTRVQ